MVLISMLISAIFSTPNQGVVTMKRAVSTLSAICLTATLMGCAQTGIHVADAGTFYVSGKQVTLSGLPRTEISTSPGMAPYPYDPNGEFETGQMYVNYIKLVKPRAKYPLMLWHGGGLSGNTWQSTPDGRPGWDQYFLRAGHDVYVSDAVERGRSGWSKFPEIYTSQPIFRAKKESWELFRIGPSYTNSSTKAAFADTQFPVEAFDNFGKSSNPRWLTNDAVTQQAYDAYVQKVCPCVLIAHSQGSSFAVAAALNAPDKIKALVLVEASSNPDPSKVAINSVKNIPTLYLWGDHINDSPLWPRFQAVSRRYYDALAGINKDADWVELPSLGIKGNGHMMMMDRNSDQIAGIVQAWLQTKGLAD
jgi:pimeloyl-ACP methyl ester carboxylesterase